MVARGKKLFEGYVRLTLLNKVMVSEYLVEYPFVGLCGVYRVCARRPCWRTKTIEDVFIKIEYISQRKIIVLFCSSNMAVVHTLYSVVSSFNDNNEVKNKIRSPKFRLIMSFFFHPILSSKLLQFLYHELLFILVSNF